MSLRKPPSEIDAMNLAADEISIRPMLSKSKILEVHAMLNPREMDDLKTGDYYMEMIQRQMCLELAKRIMDSVRFETAKDHTTMSIRLTGSICIIED
jgi:hypothetical protein